MIARVWSARTTAGNAPRYRAHFEEEVLPELRGLQGYTGAALLSRNTVGGVEIVVTTRWRSLESIRAFAGDDLERAVVSEEVLPFLSQWDKTVRHYEIALEDRTP